MSHMILQSKARPHRSDTRQLPIGTPIAVLGGTVVTFLTGAFVLDQGRGAVLSVAIFLIASGGIAYAVARHYPHPRFGACNTVTLMRMALGCALLGSLATGLVTGWAVASVAALSLALDGTDGFLARRSGLTSDFGARFDMEVDAAFALILALHALIGDPVGAEVMVLGLMRYLFIGASLIWPWLMAPLFDSMRRKAICVLQIATLIALQVPALPEDIGIILARIASVALLWSFGCDIWWLRAQR